MANFEPAFLRWRPPGQNQEPRDERFEGVGVAVDAARSRWPQLHRQIPQVLDRHGTLLLGTGDLRRAVEHGVQPPRQN